MMAFDPGTVTVPNFTQDTWAQVQAGSVIAGTKRPMFSAVRPYGPMDGRVTSQIPLPGVSVKPGAEVLSVTFAPNSTPPLKQPPPLPELTRVPDVVGRSKDDVVMILGAAHLQARLAGDENGRAARENPAAGQQVAAGSTVFVTMSLGTVIVPALSGLTLAEADARLAQDSLTRGNLSGSQAKEAVVSAQSPAAGTEVETATPVALTMRAGKGSNRSTVPDLRNMSEAEARSALRASRLRAGLVNGPSTGSVVSQSPSAGILVPSGSAVDFALNASSWWSRVWNAGGETMASVPLWAWLAAGLLVAGVLVALGWPPGPAPPSHCTLRSKNVPGASRPLGEHQPLIKATFSLRDQIPQAKLRTPVPPKIQGTSSERK